jgi:DNA-binding CsgD family transcriptional regulator
LLLAKYAKLTKTEKKILLEIGKGKNNKDITDGNCIAINTLDKHKTNLKNKLSLKNTTELIIFAHDILIITEKN